MASNAPAAAAGGTRLERLLALIESEYRLLRARAVYSCPERMRVSERSVCFFPFCSIADADADADALSPEAKAQLASIQFVDSELARLQAQAAAFQTARMAYAKALNESLNPLTSLGDTVRLSS